MNVCSSLNTQGLCLLYAIQAIEVDASLVQVSAPILVRIRSHHFPVVRFPP